LLRKLAREGNAYVGGSFLAWRNGNVYNTFVLALPDGSTRLHDKDYPSMWEACYYIGGADDGVLATPDGNVGAAVCFEFVRSETARRLKGKVEIVVGGSCWWGVNAADASERPAEKYLAELLHDTPGRFARTVGVPVVHASHAGHFVGKSWPGEPVPFPSSFMGETQIVDGAGEILARMAQAEGEGVMTADVQFGVAPGERLAIPDRFWIPELPDWIVRPWEEQLKLGREYYETSTLPYVRKRFRPRARG
jgi:predicted amidohydrolase